MESGTSHPRCYLDATVVRTLLFFFFLLSNSLDQPTNYSHFSTVGGRRGVAEGGGNGGVCDRVSPPLCCSAHDKPLLFYQDLPSLACLLQIAALFAPCSTMSQPSPGSALPDTLAYIWPRVRQPYAILASSQPCRSLPGQVEPDEEGLPEEWHASTPPAGCEQASFGCSCFLQGSHKRQRQEEGGEQASGSTCDTANHRAKASGTASNRTE